MGAYINKACGRVRGACFHRTRGGGRSIGRAVVFFHAPFGSSPQKLRTFSHTKIIIRSTCAHCARKKRAVVCIFQPFEGVFFFLLYALCAKRVILGCPLAGNGEKVWRTWGQLRAARRLHEAYILGLQVVSAFAFVGIARFFYTVSKQKNGVCPRWDEPTHNNGQTADGHTGCRSAVWPLLDRDRRAVAAHCGGRHRHRATTRGGA